MVLNDRHRIQRGWTVVGNDGKEVGKVLEVHDNHLVVEAGRLLKQNLYVPVDAVSQAADERVMVTAAAGDADKLGWRFPPERGYQRQGRLDSPRVSADDESASPATTTMTGATYGAGGGVSAAGPFAPGHGDAIADRLGGSGRAGLSGMSARADDELEPVDEGTELGASAGDADDGDTSDDTSEGTSEGTSSTTGDEAPPLT